MRRTSSTSAKLRGSAGRPTEAEAALREYKRLADQMTAIAPDNLNMDGSPVCDEDLGISLYDQHRFAEATRQFEGVAGPDGEARFATVR